MTEAQYLQLCKACDDALMSPDSTIERVSIPWLHVIREHPVFLQNYSDLFNSAFGVNLIRQRCVRFLRNRAWWLWQLVKAVRATGMYWAGPRKLPERIDFLFVSHLLNASQAEQEKDFYFSDVPANLVEQGYSVVLALINHSDFSNTMLVERSKGNGVPRVILSGALSVWEELDIHGQLKMESSRLKLAAKKSISIFDSKVLSRASQESLSSGSHRSLRMAKQVSSLVIKLQPKALIVTHEGHAWERVVFRAARGVSPDIRCVGYQHSALFRLQHAIRRNLSWEYNPDCILTAGPLGKARLAQALDTRQIPIAVGGSSRGLKTVKDDRRAKNFFGVSNMRSCLVLPEGIVSECNLLFEFSLACARKSPEIQFIWRLHPSLDFKSVISKNKKLNRIPDNVLLSDESLAFDIDRSSWALYRGTTAIIQAMGAGVRPLYLRLKSEMSIDPLYELDVWRETVECVDDFINVVESNGGSLVPDDTSLIETVTDYCDDFFAPMNLQAFKDVLVKSPGNLIVSR